MIRTDRGELPIEDLAIGDKVVTLSGNAKPIIWIGRRSYDGRFIQNNSQVLPVRIEAGAIAERIPVRDLWVSPEHALYIDGELVPARLIVNGATIVQAEAVEQVDYFHIELAEHDIIFAEGAPAETYVDCGNRGVFQNTGDCAALDQDDRLPQCKFLAPRLDEGAAELRAIRAGLCARVGALDYQFTDDPELHLLVDGVVMPAQAIADQVYSFTVPARSRAVWLASRSAIPAEVKFPSQDRRRLGVLIDRLVFCGDGLRLEIEHTYGGLSEGFHKKEHWGRWTTGMARVPEELLRLFGHGLTLNVHLIETSLRYSLDPPRRVAALG